MSRLLSNLRLLVTFLYIAAFYAPEIGFGREPLDLAAFLLSLIYRVIDGIMRFRHATGTDHSNEPGARKQSSEEFYWRVYQYQNEAQCPICGGFGPIRASSCQSANGPGHVVPAASLNNG